ncbi:hypothetical protein ABZ172_20755 [Streptomyces sp. NPDC006296]|uniref:hypothetical protein n=1 Tax=Streptomyces sp. NPDC006296 TaxID=3156746 RepID=UPI0033BA20D9
MGIESDRLVFDYLSRVGDLAQQQQLSSGARMRLVATLRGEIDRQRGTDGADSPASVRRILGRIGAPGELVSAAAESGDGTVSLPSPRTDGTAGAAGPREVPRARRGMLRKDVLRKGASRGAGKSTEPAPAQPGSTEPAPAQPGSAKPASAKPASAEPGSADPGPVSPEAGGAGAGGRGAESAGTGEPDRRAPLSDEPAPDWPAASAPHMAGLDQALSEEQSAWWLVEPGPFGEGGQGAPAVPGPMGPGTAVPGFVGGLESPELFGLPSARRPPGSRAPEEKEEPGPAAEGEEAAAAPVPVPPLRRRLRLRRPRRVVVDGGGAARPRLSHPLLLLAAALLVAGAVLGSWLALAGGWLLAYSSRKFSRAEAKWVAMGLPGVVVAGAFVWLWGRMDGRWGDPLAEGAVGDAMTDLWPVVVRVAAVASALYLVWRARRLPG